MQSGVVNPQQRLPKQSKVIEKSDTAEWFVVKIKMFEDSPLEALVLTPKLTWIFWRSLERSSYLTSLPRVLLGERPGKEEIHMSQGGASLGWS